MTAARLPHPPGSSRPVPAADRLGRRSAGLRRVGGFTRWTLAGSAAATLLLGLGYGHALPNLAGLLPTHLHDGHGSDGTGGSGTGSGGVQAPTLPGLGSGGSQTTTGAS